MSILKNLKQNIGLKEKIEKSKKNPLTSELKNEWFELEGELAVDVYQDEKNIVITAPVAGIKADNIDISIENDTIKIKGKREKIKSIKQDNYLIQECYWGAFSREIILPMPVDGTKTDAEIKQGILVIKIPKIEQPEKKKIKIKQE
ncbi:MAG: Hsp20/alpha crystallin family protein [Candidatus Pacebacteria bacterium]|nr:Hsp20/alpha crystallin family protein [Candidatus Paceibacterota bacterium]